MRSSLASLQPYWNAFVYIYEAFCFNWLRLGSLAARLFKSCSNATYLDCSCWVSIGDISNFISVGNFLYILRVSHMGVMAFLLILSTSLLSC